MKKNIKNFEAGTILQIRPPHVNVYKIIQILGKKFEKYKSYRYKIIVLVVDKPEYEKRWIGVVDLVSAKFVEEQYFIIEGKR